MKPKYLLIVFLYNRDNFIDISNTFYKTIQDQLMADLCLTEKEDYETSVEHADEHDYDFVDQSNIPDLDFSEFSSNDQVRIFLLMKRTLV